MRAKGLLSEEPAFDENDVAVAPDEVNTSDSWEEGREIPEEHARIRSDAWRWARCGTVRDVAHFFRVHEKTVETWRRKLGMPYVRVNGVIRYELAQVQAWVALHRRQKRVRESAA